MKKSCLCLLFLLTACGGVVDEASPDEGHAPPAGTAGAAPGITGMPCQSLYGRATLSAYHGDNYAASAFSFEYATQDPDVTYNEFDLLYAGNWFSVNTVTDDESTIVDLGPLALSEVPERVDEARYEAGRWGEYDAIAAHLGHTYFVHSVDGAGELVSAFTVIGLEPGVRVSIEWIRSTSPDKMVVPVQCL